MTDYLITPRIPGVRPQDPPDYDGITFVYVFTSILTPWTVPPALGNVVVVVANNQGFVPGMTIAIDGGAGYYQVVSTDALNRMTIQNLGYPANASPGTGIGAGNITTTSLPGPMGPPGTGGGGGGGSGDMTKAVYDTNNNGIVDTAESIPWTSVSGKPATFAPSTHGSTHVSSDVVPTFNRTTVGLVPASGGTVGTSNFLREDGSWASPPAGGGGGDMVKSVYDINNNGVVDTADSIPWTSVTGKPAIGDMTKAVYDTNADNIVDKAAALSTAGAAHQFWKNANVWAQVDWSDLTGIPATFAPDSTAMLKSVYDTNLDNIVDHAALADAAPWTGITGRPSTFPPSGHGGTHTSAGGDPTPLVTTGASGLVGTAPNDANKTFLGTAAWGFLPCETETSASFTIPAAGATVAISIVAATWGAAGQTILISDGTNIMFAELTTRTSNTSWTVTNRGYRGNNVSGTMATAALVSLATPGIATSSQPGLVPTPSGTATDFFGGDAAFHPYSTIPAFTSTVSGLVPASGGGTTNYLRADGTFNAPPGSGGGTKTCAVFTALANMPLATNYAIFLTRNNTGLLAFNDTTAYTAMFVGIIPQAASLGSGLVVTISWIAASATTGNVVWKVQFDRASATSADTLTTDSFDVSVSATTACNGTNGKLAKTAITITTIDSIAAEDGFRLQVIRDAANGSDTMVGDAQVLCVEVATV